MKELIELNKKIIACEKCPRLITHCKEIAKNKKREFLRDTYWGKPVPGFGDPNAEVWVIGLAPAAHGANRTGRMFTGDSSGRWLYRALYETGFSSSAISEKVKDGLKLKRIYISAAARCAPPDNKPTVEELAQCSSFLDEELQILNRVSVYLVLGKIAFDTTIKFLERQKVEIPKPKPKFSHGAFFQFEKVSVLCSYHPSRQNTQTGKLTEKMWLDIFIRLRKILDSKK